MSPFYKILEFDLKLIVLSSSGLSDRVQVSQHPIQTVHELN